MQYYTDQRDHRNSPVVSKPTRLALRLSRELGISIDHATAAVIANNACKEAGDD